MKKLLLLTTTALMLFANEIEMQVYKPVTSTCPKSWLTDMEKMTDDKVKVVSMMNVRGFKHQIGVPREMQSCNTSIYKEYIIEGNVPAKAIKDFFKDIPKNALGLALPVKENDKEIKTVYVIFDDKTYKEFGKY